MKNIASVFMVTLILAVVFPMAFDVQTVRAEPSTWTVDDDGPADFSSIQEAINAASSGDSVQVYPGNYVENPLVNKSLNIFGSGSEVTVVTYDDQAYGEHVWDIFNITSSHVNLTGFEISGAFDGAGVLIGTTADYVNISNNKIELNDYGIHVFNSTHNTISGNIIMSNNYPGIWLHYSETTSNLIDGNIIAFCGEGIKIESCEGNIVDGNSIHNMHAGIHLWKSANNILINNIIDNCTFGVPLYYNSSENHIRANRIIESQSGLNIYEGSNNNTVAENSLVSSGYQGVSIYKSHNNELFHNNLIDNVEQASVVDSVSNIWDDGYPSGGNYWSDYTDVDSYKGQHQNASGSDGVWDQPYIIDVDNQDMYPLTRPFGGPAGDVDGDRDVDIFDIVRMAGVYGVKYPNLRYDRLCDMDLDGDIDIFDIVKAAGNYGKSWQPDLIHVLFGDEAESRRTSYIAMD